LKNCTYEGDRARTESGQIQILSRVFSPTAQLFAALRSTRPQSTLTYTSLHYIANSLVLLHLPEKGLEDYSTYYVRVCLTCVSLVNSVTRFILVLLYKCNQSYSCSTIHSAIKLFLFHYTQCNQSYSCSTIHSAIRVILVSLYTV
jgi:hypothetical protein